MPNPPAPIGSYVWMQQTQGNLTFREKAALARAITWPSLSQFLRTALRTERPMRNFSLDDVSAPDSIFAQRAAEELATSCSPAIVAHSWRSYFWGAAFAKLEDVSYDAELLLVSSLFHDAGMADSYTQQRRCRCFTHDSVDALQRWSERYHYPEEKTHRAAEFICLHMNGYLDESFPAEARLLQQGATCDVVGSGYRRIPKMFRESLLRLYPRQNFNAALIRFFKEEAHKSPDTRAALLKQLGTPMMMHLSPFGSN